MAAKPWAICQLRAGRALDSFSGFVGTFNYIAKFVANLTGADGIEIDTSAGDDQPVIRLKGGIANISVKKYGDTYQLVSGGSGDSAEETVIATFVKQSVVTNVSYDEGTHQFSQQKRDIFLIAPVGDESDSAVFTAYPASE